MLYITRMDRDYYTSERFIHDDVVQEAEGGLRSLYDTWANQGSVDPFVMSWPSERIKYHGIATEQPVPFDLTGDRSSWLKELKSIAESTKAFALLLVEQREKAVVAIVESRHGTVSWHIPICNHGNVLVLGDKETRVDRDCLGVLWSPPN